MRRLIFVLLALLALSCGTASELGRASLLDRAKASATTSLDVLTRMYPQVIFGYDGEIRYRGVTMTPAWRIDGYMADYWDVAVLQPYEICRIDFFSHGSYRDYRNAIAFHLYTLGAPECPLDR